MKVLARGSRGDDVAELQRKLQKLGHYRGRVDGDYGKGTYAAIIEFQQQYNVDGIASATVQMALDKSITAREVGPDETPIPIGRAEVEETYGKFSYRLTNEVKWGKNAWLSQSGDWISEYIVSVNLPILGDQEINKNIETSLTAVLKRIVDLGLDREVRQFGCYAPRCKMHNRERPPSLHSWAAAVDINWDENGVGTGQGKLDPGIVHAFESYGWIWGGRWRTSDPMHFQLAKGY